MDYFRELLELVVISLKKMRDSYILELQSSPDGNLICNLSHKRNRYYHSLRIDGTYKRKHLSPLIKGESDFINQLARKEYIKKSLPLIDSNIAQLERALSRYSPVDPGSVLKHMKSAYQYLEISRFFETADADSLENQMLHQLSHFDNMGTLFKDPDEFVALRLGDHKSWAAESYERNTYPFGDDIILASDGTRTRSKAEAVWYDKLKLFDVPFKFDKLTYFGDNPDTGFWHAPDFTFEDSNYDEFYLEYCGKMDDPEYVKRHKAKLKKYEDAGIVPWKNIIYDYAEKNNFDVGKIESIIRYQIIPRL